MIYEPYFKVLSIWETFACLTRLDFSSVSVQDVRVLSVVLLDDLLLAALQGK